jgi:lipoprotein-anchoring transpeptidase ErfK/SrfK
MKPIRLIANVLGMATLLLTTILLPAQTAVSASARRHRVVVVSIPDRQLAVLENGTILRTFLISVGAQKTPSPIGEFEIVSRIAHPSYSHDGTVIPAGPNNPLGPRWMGLSINGYGIHGTNQPGSIGKAASHGCIRLSNHDIVELFSLLSVGDTVLIRAERDAQIAKIFGAEDHATLVQAHLMTLNRTIRIR